VEAYLIYIMAIVTVLLIVQAGVMVGLLPPGAPRDGAAREGGPPANAC
jgi:hypothetical protein